MYITVNGKSLCTIAYLEKSVRDPKIHDYVFCGHQTEQSARKGKELLLKLNPDLKPEMVSIEKGGCPDSDIHCPE